MFQPIKVIDVELSRPLETISNLEGYGGIEALVRLHGRPIAKVHLPINGGCCPAKTLMQAVLEQHSGKVARSLILNELAAIPENQFSLSDLLKTSQPIEDEDFPLVTIAVCTRDRVTDLQLCLEAISRLDYPNLDILVVDNAPSNDATEKLLSTTFPQIRYIPEPRPGLSWARNRAIVESRGEIIAYTDDDVSVDPGWIRALVKAFASSAEVMAVTGYVAAYELETKAQIVFEQSYRFGRGFKRKWVQVEQEGRKASVAEYGATAILGTGANMAYRRDLFDRIGSFDPALGSGTVTAGGEDLEMFFRVLKEGYVLIYEPNALVRHRHRHDYAQLKKQITNNNVGYCSYLVRSVLAYPDTYFDFIQIGLACLLSSINRLLRSFIRPSRYPRDLILSELQGFYLGFGRYQQACQVATQIADNFGEVVPEIHQKMAV